MVESHCHPDVIRQNLFCPRDVARRQKCIQQGPVWKMEIVSREALIRPSRGTKPMSRLKRYYFSLFFPKEQAASLLHLQKKTSKQRKLRFKNTASSDTGTKQRNQIILFCRKILYSEGSEKGIVPQLRCQQETEFIHRWLSWRDFNEGTICIKSGQL